MLNSIKETVVGAPAKETKPQGNLADKAKEMLSGAGKTTGEAPAKETKPQGNLAGKATEMLSGAAKTTGEAAQVGKDNTVKFIQGTGEQVKGAAIGATEAVKSTLGMAPAEKK